jgi:hypothetical protein
MKRKSLPVLWMGVAFGVALGLAAAVVAVKGTDAKSIGTALQLTARWSFLLFWVAYAGRAVTELFGSSFEPLARRGREFGLAYASAMLIHLGLVIWLCYILSRAPLSGTSLAFFVLGMVWTYLLAVLSFGRLAEALGPSGWRVVRVAGLNYILYAFAIDFVTPLIRAGSATQGVWHLVGYAPFAAMSVAAPLLVLTAAAHRRVGIKYSRARFGPVVN